MPASRNPPGDATENLHEAFAGESQAYQKYAAFAEKAEREGFASVARLFRTTAEAERVHAAGHLKALEKVNSTIDNLKEAIGGETYEFEQMYPPMLAQAEAEGHQAKRMFGYAVDTEAVHAKLYALALTAVQNGEDLTETEFYLCPVCAHRARDSSRHLSDLRREGSCVRATVGRRAPRLEPRRERARGFDPLARLHIHCGAHLNR